jgi:hypothetical protein
MTVHLAAGPCARGAAPGDGRTADPRLVTCPDCVFRTLTAARCPEHLAKLWATRDILIGGWCPACGAWWAWDDRARTAIFEFPRRTRR